MLPRRWESRPWKWLDRWRQVSLCAWLAAPIRPSKDCRLHSKGDRSGEKTFSISCDEAAQLAPPADSNNMEREMKFTCQRAIAIVLVGASLLGFASCSQTGSSAGKPQIA